MRYAALDIEPDSRLWQLMSDKQGQAPDNLDEELGFCVRAAGFQIAVVTTKMSNPSSIAPARLP